MKIFPAILATVILSVCLAGCATVTGPKPMTIRSIPPVESWNLMSTGDVSLSGKYRMPQGWSFPITHHQNPENMNEGGAVLRARKSYGHIEIIAKAWNFVIDERTGSLIDTSRVQCVLFLEDGSVFRGKTGNLFEWGFIPGQSDDSEPDNICFILRNGDDQATRCFERIDGQATFIPVMGAAPLVNDTERIPDINDPDEWKVIRRYRIFKTSEEDEGYAYELQNRTNPTQGAEALTLKCRKHSDINSRDSNIPGYIYSIIWGYKIRSQPKDGKMDVVDDHNIQIILKKADGTWHWGAPGLKFIHPREWGHAYVITGPAGVYQRTISSLLDECDKLNKMCELTTTEIITTGSYPVIAENTISAPTDSGFPDFSDWPRDEIASGVWKYYHWNRNNVPDYELGIEYRVKPEPDRIRYGQFFYLKDRITGASQIVAKAYLEVANDGEILYSALRYAIKRMNGTWYYGKIGLDRPEDFLDFIEDRNGLWVVLEKEPPVFYPFTNHPKPPDQT